MNTDTPIRSIDREWVLPHRQNAGYVPPPPSGGELKLINQGTYGCIFYPGINCKGNKESAKYLTKIQKNAKTIENEMHISELIKGIKGYTKHFAPIVKQCPVKIAKQYTQEMQQCELFRNIEPKDLHKQTYVSNKIRYVGNTNLSDYIQEQNTPYTFWKELLETHAYLLKGVQKLITKKLVHYDIKYNNIMVDPDMQKPIFIDFGITVPIAELDKTNLYDYFYVFDTYPYWCFEVCMCNYIFHELKYSNAKTTVVDEKTINHIYNVFVYGAENTDAKTIENSIFSSSIFKQNTGKIIDEYRKTILQYYQPFIGSVTWWDLYQHFVEKEFYKTWDTYSLAVVYLFIIENAQTQNPELYKQLENTTKPVFNQYMALLFSMIFTSPDKRPTSDMAIKSLRQIMKLAESVLA